VTNDVIARYLHKLRLREGNRKERTRADSRAKRNDHEVLPASASKTVIACLLRERGVYPVAGLRRAPTDLPGTHR
jgi:hypothetical protein